MESTSNATGNAELDLEQLIRELDAGFHSLPRQAIRAAQQHRELAIPRLIQAIGEATEQMASGVVPEGNAHFFAMFLLTEFRAKEALPVILDAISLPGEGPFELFGDGLTESLSCVLAELASDSIETIDNLIADRSLNKYVRWEAAQTYLHFVRDGLLTREEAVERLRYHLRTAIANEDAELAEGLVAELVSYAPHEALEDIQEAFRLDLVDRGMVGPRDVELSIAEGQSGFQRELSHCPPTGFEDTLEELSRWASFQEKRQSVRRPASTSWNDDADEGEPNLGHDDGPDAPGTIRNTEQRVGRNAPCPCGSGRKYKKCCGVG